VTIFGIVIMLMFFCLGIGLLVILWSEFGNDLKPIVYIVVSAITLTSGIAGFMLFHTNNNNQIAEHKQQCANKNAEYYKIYRDYLCLTEDGRIVR
jgi:hypothetical protein